MDERGWFTATKPTSLFATASEKASRRKSVLAMSACIRTFWDQIPEPVCRAALCGCEEFADGLVSDEAFHILRRTLRVYPHQDIQCVRAFRAVERLAEADAYLWRVMKEVTQVVRDKPGRQRLCAILRDIFGNPFRPVAFSPAWRTDTAVALARQMYEAREFGAMPILADALQDAGCTNEDILTHCRDPEQVHVRGCWVVDLVLGKAEGRG